MLPVLYFTDPNFRFSHDTKQQIAFWLAQTPLHFLWVGGAAVIFFFVLSGFVLSASMNGKPNLGSYHQYFIKRFFRLYIPMVAAILFSLLMQKIFYRQLQLDTFTEWLRGIWSHQVTIEEFKRLITFRNRDFHNVVTTLWSIEVEIKISLLIPFMLLVHNIFDRFRLFKVFWSFILITTAFLLSHNNVLLFPNNADLIYDRLIWSYIFPFTAGILLYKYRIPLIAFFENITRVELIVFLLITIFFHCASSVAWMMLGYDFFSPIFMYETDVVTITSCVFILLSFSRYAEKFLLHNILRFFGKISFSLYLIHPVIIAIATYTLIGHGIHITIIWLIIYAVSTGLAYLYNKYIEVPANNMGRWVAGLLPPYKGQKH
jgi:peptidoglycan/LPS O-acetylase OafA/YrhL